MVHCCVPFCCNNKTTLSKFIKTTGKRRSFHAFPLSPARKKEWLTKIRRDEGAKFKVSQDWPRPRLGPSLIILILYKYK